MTRHVDDCGAEIGRRLHVSNRAEEAGDDVESAAEVETAHVSQMENDLGMASASDLEHFGREIDTLHNVVLLEEREMRAGPACDIEERVAGRGFLLGDDLAQTLRIGFVILEAVEGVVNPREFRILRHRATDWLACLEIGTQ